MATPSQRRRLALDWIDNSELSLAQISYAQILKREDWETLGATYPKHDIKSVFRTRPWDSGKLSEEQKRVMVNRRRQILLES